MGRNNPAGRRFLRALGRLRWLLALALAAGLGCHSARLPEQVNFSPFPDSSPPPVHFFSFGDWGTGNSDQLAVADTVIVYCTLQPCDFGLLLGDNFYTNGVASVSDPQWQNKFEGVYPATDLPIPFYAVLGNHDHDGNEQAQIDYSALQDRWKMPSAYYRVTFPAGTSPSILEIFAFDSVYGGAPDSAFLTQLAQDLDNSTAQWKLLAMHYPIYSNGLHGDTKAFRDTLVPVICNRVDAVFSGHDHLFSHLTDPAGGPDGCSFQQFVVGTGGRGRYSVRSRPGVAFAESTHGFAAVGVSPTSFTVSFYRTDGSLAYQHSLQP